MAKPTLPTAASSSRSRSRDRDVGIPVNSSRRRPRKIKENGDVLVSAVLSTYLLTYLHHVLQRAEYGAVQEGRTSQAANFAQLRKVLCMDARSMEDASAAGMRDADLEKACEAPNRSKAA